MIIYTPFISEKRNDFPEITPRGYKKHYTSHEIEDDSEEVAPIIETETLQEIDFSVPDINYRFPDRESFKSRMLHEYTSALQARGIDPSYAKVLVAQDALESAWGSKPSGSYNYGGIKGKGRSLATTEFINGKYIKMNDNFRDFSSIQEYINYKIDLLNSPRYRAFSGNISEFADRVKAGGYATAPNYVQVLKSIISKMQNGGILKFEKGGKEYLENNREHYNKQVGLNSFLPVGNIPYNLVKRKLNNIRILQTAPLLLQDNWDDYHTVVNKFTDTIHVNENSPYKDIAKNHEVGHIISKPLIKNIENLIKKWDGKIFMDDSEKLDSYRDSAKEIGARMYAYLQDSGYNGNRSSQDTLRFVGDERDRFTSEYSSDIINSNNRTRSVHDKNNNITFINRGDNIQGLESKVYRKYDDPYDIFSRYNDSFIYDLIKLFYATKD